MTTSPRRLIPIRLIGEELDLPSRDSWPVARHRFDHESVWALNAAIAAGRPLLIRGEPGLGKSQLARAAAEALNVPFLCHVINGRSEPSDLLYKFDAVARLAQAQVVGSTKGVEGESVADLLRESSFVSPGMLWWAFDWESALEQHQTSGARSSVPTAPKGWKSGHGCVVLIDEIDKADSDLPNGLLESLGNLGFAVPQANQSIRLKDGLQPPLIVVTTNEERELPAPFLRRCLVLQMRFPSNEKDQLDYLGHRGRTHFPKLDQDVALEAAQQLLQDREAAIRQGLPRPGPAEFLDLLRALQELAPDPKGQFAALKEIQRFVLRKNPDEPAL